MTGLEAVWAPEGRRPLHGYRWDEGISSGEQAKTGPSHTRGGHGHPEPSGAVGASRATVAPSSTPLAAVRSKSAEMIRAPAALARSSKNAAVNNPQPRPSPYACNRCRLLARHVTCRRAAIRSLTGEKRTWRGLCKSVVRGRVEMWRGSCRSNLSVAASFVWRCLNSSTMAPFPHPAHRTGRAALPHPALGQDFTLCFRVQRHRQFLNTLRSL